MSRSYYESSEWKILRQGALEDSDYKCERCSSKNNLHVHHKYGLIRKFDLEVLCADCHAKHHGREDIAKFGRSYREVQLNTFEALGTRASDWIWNGEKEIASGPCELCGCQTVIYAFPIVAYTPTGEKVLNIGSECVVNFTNADKNLLKKAKGQAKKLKKFADQACISLNDSEFILSTYKKRILIVDKKYHFIALSGFLNGVVHVNAKAQLYEISSIVAERLLYGVVTGIDLGYLENYRKFIRRKKLEENGGCIESCSIC